MKNLMRLIKRSALSYIIKRGKRDPDRLKEKSRRLNEIRERRSIMTADLLSGYKLCEFDIDSNVDGNKFLYQLGGLTYTQILELYKKYRGFKSSEHPQIYNKSYETRRPT